MSDVRLEKWMAVPECAWLTTGTGLDSVILTRDELLDLAYTAMALLGEVPTEMEEVCGAGGELSERSPGHPGDDQCRARSD